MNKEPLKNSHKYYEGNLGPKLSNKQRLDTLSINFTEDEMEAITNICRQQDITFNEFFRRAVNVLNTKEKNK